ncbi:MAG: 3-isopropylmalate dehydrogenase [Epsilonproteobacteria bacterium]|jgi:3-isopropylmalate dehydrogenase|nr:3-isopropylmalate dehydrogenase [Campylobacterota bacterium]NPA89136.1 3-isopropylmalate dehydrogenase [Campylobacterota bacterium]
MREYKIAVIEGDGIGPEIIREAIKVLDKVGEKEGFKLNYSHYLLGGVAVDKTGDPCPPETIEGALNSDAVLFGAIGGPKWDTLPKEKRPETGLLKIRKELGLFANLRPAVVFDQFVDASPLKPEVVKGVDLLVVRELTGGIYFGQPRGREENQAFNTMRYTREEIERIAHIAFKEAQKRRKKVTSIDKANVLEVSQFWREIVEEVAKNYPDVELEHMYVDNGAMQLVRNPRQFDVILTGNIFGDILSDEASMIVGSIGLLPSASIGGKVGLFEPIHGSAPDIAGKGIANPIATILSAGMMLGYLGEVEGERRIKRAVEKVLAEGHRTPDLGGNLTTQEMGDLIAKAVEEV